MGSPDFFNKESFHRLVRNATQRFEAHYRLNEFMVKNKKPHKIGFGFHFWHLVFALTPAVLLYRWVSDVERKLDVKWMESGPHPLPPGTIVKEWPPPPLKATRYKVLSRRQRKMLYEDYLDPPPLEFYARTNMMIRLRELEETIRELSNSKEPEAIADLQRSIEEARSLQEIDKQESARKGKASGRVLGGRT